MYCWLVFVIVAPRSINLSHFVGWQEYICLPISCVAGAGRGLFSAKEIDKAINL
jgi:hypothetical protein